MKDNLTDEYIWIKINENTKFQKGEDCMQAMVIDNKNIESKFYLFFNLGYYYFYSAGLFAYKKLLGNLKNGDNVI